MKIIKFAILFMMILSPAFSATVVATVNGVPVTDADITARTKLMAREGNTSTNNRRVALQNIIDDQYLNMCLSCIIHKYYMVLNNENRDKYDIHYK